MTGCKKTVKLPGPPTVAALYERRQFLIVTSRAVIEAGKNWQWATCQMSNVCCAMFNVLVKAPDDLLTKPPNLQLGTI